MEWLRHKKPLATIPCMWKTQKKDQRRPRAGGRTQGARGGGHWTSFPGEEMILKPERTAAQCGEHSRYQGTLSLQMVAFLFPEFYLNRGDPQVPRLTEAEGRFEPRLPVLWVLSLNNHSVPSKKRHPRGSRNPLRVWHAGSTRRTFVDRMH